MSRLSSVHILAIAPTNAPLDKAFNWSFIAILGMPREYKVAREVVASNGRGAKTKVKALAISII